MIKDGSPGLSHDFSSNSLNADREEEEQVMTPQVKEQSSRGSINSVPG